MQDYFEGQGYALPRFANPADHFMDIIAGSVAPCGPNAVPAEVSPGCSDSWSPG